ncbi:hypothetical protein TIFTF001_023155 [Ficus carica]|uniref:Uncharacterized protein n=1 Tax=Ficus carica TaxID=3494 RepID=A0AA88AFN6_FICCA|nr:hypothetical protein TIFTF001_023155 [Ficus carica]
MIWVRLGSKEIKEGWFLRRPPLPNHRDELGDFWKCSRNEELDEYNGAGFLALKDEFKKIDENTHA